MTTLPPPSRLSVDVILQEAPDFRALRSRDVNSSEVFVALSEFISVIYATDFVVSFDWMDEYKQSTDLDPHNLEPIEKADLPTLRKLLIAHLRLDRFCDGHLKLLLSTGYLEKLIERLKVLRPAT